MKQLTAREVFDAVLEEYSPEEISKMNTDELSKVFNEIAGERRRECT